MRAQPITTTLMWRETDCVPHSTDDFAGLENIVREHSRLIFKVAYGVLRNAHDAEDVVQEVFLRVHRSGTNGVIDMRAWLARIAFCLAIDRMREPQGEELSREELPSDAADAEHLAIHRQRMMQVRRLIGGLPDDLRHPLVLSAMDNFNSRSPKCWASPNPLCAAASFARAKS